MATPQENKDQNSIRHFKGSVGQFKQMFDDLAGGENTNAYDSPVQQGYDIQNTRGDVKSPHWEEDEETQNENRIPSFDLFESKESDELSKQINKAIVKIDDSLSYKDFALAVSKTLKDDYGKHLFKKFMEVLHKDLGI